MSGNEKRERELESFLAEDNSRIAALYRKLPKAEPDAALDASVLAMARRAIPARAPASRPRHVRWLPAFSAAAVVALAAGVAMRMGPQMWTNRGAPASLSVPAAAKDELDRQQTAPPSDRIETQRADAPAAAMAEKPVPQAPKPAPVPMREGMAMKSLQAQSKPGEIADKKAKSEARAAQPFPQQTLAGGTANAAAAAPATATAPAAEIAREEPVPAQAESDLAKQSDSSAAAAPQPTSASTRRMAAPPHRSEPAQTMAAPTAPPPPAPMQTMAAPTAAASPPPPAPVQTMTAPASAPAVQAYGATAPPSAGSAGKVSEPALERERAAAASARDAGVADPNENLYPEHWLTNIRRMLSDGKHDEALRSLGKFREKYPDYQLPDDLRDLK
jgi:hypothetical protein